MSPSTVTYSPVGTAASGHGPPRSTQLQPRPRAFRRDEDASGPVLRSGGLCALLSVLSFLRCIRLLLCVCCSTQALSRDSYSGPLLTPDPSVNDSPVTLTRGRGERRSSVESSRPSNSSGAPLGEANNTERFRVFSVALGRTPGSPGRFSGISRAICHFLIFLRSPG